MRTLTIFFGRASFNLPTAPRYLVSVCRNGGFITSNVTRPCLNVRVAALNVRRVRVVSSTISMLRLYRVRVSLNEAFGFNARLMSLLCLVRVRGNVLHFLGDVRRYLFVTVRFNFGEDLLYVRYDAILSPARGQYRSHPVRWKVKKFRGVKRRVAFRSGLSNRNRAKRRVNVDGFRSNVFDLRLLLYHASVKTAFRRVQERACQWKLQRVRFLRGVSALSANERFPRGRKCVVFFRESATFRVQGGDDHADRLRLDLLVENLQNRPSFGASAHRTRSLFAHLLYLTRGLRFHVGNCRLVVDLHRFNGSNRTRHALHLRALRVFNRDDRFFPSRISPGIRFPERRHLNFMDVTCVATVAAMGLRLTLDLRLSNRLQRGINGASAFLNDRLLSAKDYGRRIFIVFRDAICRDARHTIHVGYLPLFVNCTRTVLLLYRTVQRYRLQARVTLTRLT